MMGPTPPNRSHGGAEDGKSEDIPADLRDRQDVSECQVTGGLRDHRTAECGKGGQRGKHQHEGQGDPVIETAFHIQRLPNSHHLRAELPFPSLYASSLVSNRRRYSL